MSIRVHENSKELDLWRSRDEALAVLAQQLTGTWSACLHGSGKGWILVCDGSKRFDRNGALDFAGNDRPPCWPEPLRVQNLDREGVSSVNVEISFDNSTGVRAQVKSQLSKRGNREMQASIFCPPLSSGATIEDARELAYSLLSAADDAEKVLASMPPRSSLSSPK